MQRFHFLLNCICALNMKAVFRDAATEWFSTLNETLTHFFFYCLHQVGSKNCAEWSCGSSQQTKGGRRSVCVMQHEQFSEHYACFLCMCITVCGPRWVSLSPSGCWNMNAWRNCPGYPARIFFCSHRLGGISCDKGIQGERVCFKSHFCSH